MRTRAREISRRRDARGAPNCEFIDFKYYKMFFLSKTKLKLWKNYLELELTGVTGVARSKNVLVTEELI